jgi:hypothetical protein
MAIGTPAPSLVAGLAATPAVTGPANVITPDAVTALVDSFGKGVITGDDLAAHTGFMAHLKNRAEAQKISEDISPSAIQAREAQRQSSIAGSNLVQAQAAATQGLIPAQSDIAAEKLKKENAEIWDKNAIDIFKEYNPTIYKADGVTPDTQGMAEAGRNYLRAKDALAYASQGLASQPSKELDPDTNQPIIVQRNSIGEDVTPREDNPAYTHYRDLRQKGIEMLFTPTKPHSTRGQGPTGAVSSAVEPAPAPATISPDLIGPAIVPHPSIGQPIYQSGTGRPAGAIPGTTLPETISAVQKFPEYESWTAKQESMNNFVDAANAIRQPIPPQDKTLAGPIMNQKDFALIQAVKQLATPTVSAASGRTMPDLQSKALEDTMPSLELLTDWKQVLSKQGTLSEGTRKRLIELGTQYVKSKERSALPRIQWAVENTKRNPGEIFGSTSPEAMLHSGKSVADRLAVEPAPVAAAAGSDNLEQRFPKPATAPADARQLKVGVNAGRWYSNGHLY